MKITRKRLVRLIKEAMYSARGRRDADIDKLGEPFAGKLKTLVTHPEPETVTSGNELLQSFAGYEPSYEFPDATGYTEEIEQFDQKMRDSRQQHIENSLAPEDRRLRKSIVDFLFDPTGIWRIPVDRLTNPNTQHPDGLWSMHFMLWNDALPEDIWEQLDDPDFESQVEKVFNSMGGSHYQGDGDTLVPLTGITQQDQLAFNQVILKVLNGDPEYV